MADLDLVDGCTCGKVRYASRRQAKRTLRREFHWDQSMCAYPGPTSGFFHLGHMPAAVRNGDLDRRDIASRTRTRG
jgi:hypothetical protein